MCTIICFSPLTQYVYNHLFQSTHPVCVQSFVSVHSPSMCTIICFSPLTQHVYNHLFQSTHPVCVQSFVSVHSPSMCTIICFSPLTQYVYNHLFQSTHPVCVQSFVSVHSPNMCTIICFSPLTQYAYNHLFQSLCECLDLLRNTSVTQCRLLNSNKISKTQTSHVTCVSPVQSKNISLNTNISCSMHSAYIEQ